MATLCLKLVQLILLYTNLLDYPQFSPLCLQNNKVKSLARCIIKHSTKYSLLNTTLHSHTQAHATRCHLL